MSKIDALYEAARASIAAGAADDKERTNATQDVVDRAYQEYSDLADEETVMALVEVYRAAKNRPHAHTVPDAGDGQPGVLVSPRHSDFVACPMCDAIEKVEALG